MMRFESMIFTPTALNGKLKCHAPICSFFVQYLQIQDPQVSESTGPEPPGDKKGHRSCASFTSGGFSDAPGLCSLRVPVADPKTELLVSFWETRSYIFMS